MVDTVEAQTEKALGLKPMPKDTGFGLTPKAVEEAELVRNKEIVDAKDISQEPPTAKQLAKTAIDFTPVIGDIVGGYEAAAEINEELKEVNPNYVYIGALGGATAVGMIPFLGDAAKKLMDLGASKVKRAKEKVVAPDTKTLKEKSEELGLDTDVYHYTIGSDLTTGKLMGDEFNPDIGSTGDLWEELGVHVGSRPQAAEARYQSLTDIETTPSFRSGAPLDYKLLPGFQDALDKYMGQTLKESRQGAAIIYKGSLKHNMKPPVAQRGQLATNKNITDQEWFEALPEREKQRVIARAEEIAIQSFGKEKLLDHPDIIKDSVIFKKGHLGTTLPLRANLSNPLPTKDGTGIWTEEDATQWLEKTMVKIDSDYIMRGENRPAGKDRAKILRQKLANLGYTHIAYLNDVEDKGRLSYLMLTDRGPDSDKVLASKFAKFDPAQRKNPKLGLFEGGDVPHADEPYLDGRAEKILKEFNKPNDEFLDTAIDLATEPLQEAKEAFMQAGKGAVFEMLPKDDPRIYQAFRQTNDYLAGLGYAGYKTGEAAAKFVAGSIADALGQDKGEIGEGILRSEASAAKDIMAMPEAFAGMVGPKSVQMLDDAIDSFGGYFKLLKTAGPVIKADLGGKLQALADGDFDFLKESSSPKTVSAQVTGQGTTPVDQPDPKSLTKPKSLVSPLFKTVSSEKLTGYSSWGDSNPFYSSVEAAIENLPVGKEGIKGSNVIKYLTKKAPNINMRELYWSGMLENAPMRGVEDYTIPNTDQRGIDPNKIYTKEELKYIADVSMPQVMVRKFTSSSTDYKNQPQWRGSQQVPMNIFTLEPMTVGASSTTPTRSRIVNRRNTNGQETFRIGRGNFEGGQSPNSEYVEYLITNVNPRGSVYPKADAHWRRVVDGKQENVLTHVRGSFIPIIYPTSTTRTTKGMVGKGKIQKDYTTTNVFVVDEIQADPAQKNHFGNKPETSKVASQKTSKETADILNTPEVNPAELLTNNLISEVDNIGTSELIPTSDRFNRLFGVDENDAFPVQTNKVNAGLKEIAETLADVEKRFLANDLDADEVANIIRATFNDKLKTTAILRNTRGPNAFPEAVINQIKLNVLGDLIYGKGTVRANKVLKDNLTKVIENSIGGKPQPPTDITPVGIGDSVRLGLLAIMREAVKKDTNTIVIPPLDDMMKTHSLGEKPTKETYEDAMMKALRILRSETNKKVSFEKGKIKGLQFDSDKNYLIINFDSDIVDETKQTRFAEGGLV